MEVTKPDGSKETLGPFTSDPVGGGWTIYTPTQVGTYTFVAKFAGTSNNRSSSSPWGLTIDTISGATSVNDTYSASESDPMQLTCRRIPIQAWSETPLPTQYWTRPINSANRDWYVLAGNWLGWCRSKRWLQPLSFGYGTGPESAHIMWSTPMWAGGIMDARFGETGYQTAHYEGLDFSPPIILNGKIYYNVQSLPKKAGTALICTLAKTEYFHNTTGPVTGISS